MKKTKEQIEQMKQEPVVVPEVIKPPEDTRWYDTQRVIEILQQAMCSQWNWSNNTRCKHIDLKIDMRGHSCQVRDREGIVISIEKLKHQYGVK